MPGGPTRLRLHAHADSATVDRTVDRTAQTVRRGHTGSLTGDGALPGRFSGMATKTRHVSSCRAWSAKLHAVRDVGTLLTPSRAQRNAECAATQAAEPRLHAPANVHGPAQWQLDRRLFAGEHQAALCDCRGCEPECRDHLSLGARGGMGAGWHSLGHDGCGLAGCGTRPSCMAASRHRGGPRAHTAQQKTALEGKRCTQYFSFHIK